MGYSVGIASLINRFIAILYFCSLIFVVGTVFIRNKLENNFLLKVVFYLSIILLIIILMLPIELFK
ncbi:hypothetical protein EDF67_103318 [Sphingobacterium sp. JUb78]|nr:uncharacterized membrane protein YtjA (UPF0391 family) [Sphingobacterium kitahiroshimense]TCR11905.1 hypothetical protein EDF67_103318 [Sphingobacterium sp. JUb78]